MLIGYPATSSVRGYAKRCRRGNTFAFLPSWRLHWLCICMCVCVLSHVLLCDPMDCSPPGSPVHGIFQVRILEWVAISSSRGSSRPRDQTCISWASCIGRRSLLLSYLRSPWLCIHKSNVMWILEIWTKYTSYFHLLWVPCFSQTSKILCTERDTGPMNNDYWLMIP